MTPTEILSAIIYLAALFPAIHFVAFREEDQQQLQQQANEATSSPKVKGRRSLQIAFVFIVTALAMKLGYELRNKEPNLYELLEVHRHSNTQDIRQAYKKVSRKMHPDKNPLPDAEANFQRIKDAYDILMDEEGQRDIYNRFGKEGLSFDPRLDNLKLICSVGGGYLFWMVSSICFTIPSSMRASRPWIGLVALVAMVLELSLYLTSTTLPEFRLPLVLPSLTERELIKLVHGVFPAVIVSLACLARVNYVDVNKAAMTALADVTQQQKAIGQVLQELEVVMGNVAAGRKPGLDTNAAQQIAGKIADLRESMSHSAKVSIGAIDILKIAGKSTFQKYYWVVFLLMAWVVWSYYPTVFLEGGGGEGGGKGGGGGASAGRGGA